MSPPPVLTAFAGGASASCMLSGSSNSAIYTSDLQCLMISCVVNFSNDTGQGDSDERAMFDLSPPAPYQIVLPPGYTTQDSTGAQQDPDMILPRLPPVGALAIKASYRVKLDSSISIAIAVGNYVDYDGYVTFDVGQNDGPMALTFMAMNGYVSLYRGTTLIGTQAMSGLQMDKLYPAFINIGGVSVLSRSKNDGSTKFKTTPSGLSGGLADFTVIGSKNPYFSDSPSVLKSMFYFQTLAARHGGTDW